MVGNFEVKQFVDDNVLAEAARLDVCSLRYASQWRLPSPERPAVAHLDDVLVNTDPFGKNAYSIFSKAQPSICKS